MKSVVRPLFAVLMLLIISSCRKDESDTVPRSIDFGHFEAFEFTGSAPSTIIKEREGLIYFINSGGSSPAIYEYNFERKELLRTINLPSNFQGVPFEIGTNNGAKELYTLLNNSVINIYRLDDITLTDQINVLCSWHKFGNQCHL